MTTPAEPLFDPKQPMPGNDDAVFSMTDRLRSGTEMVLIFGRRLGIALFTLFTIAYVTFVGMTMARGWNSGLRWLWG